MNDFMNEQCEGESVFTLGGAKAVRTIRLRLASICFAVLSTVACVHAAPPQVTLVSELTVPEDTSTNLVFTVSDSDSPLFTVTMTASSSDTSLVGSGGLAFSGAGSSRILQITPTAHQYGSATLTIVATDNNGELTVKPSCKTREDLAPGSARASD